MNTKTTVIRWSRAGALAALLILAPAGPVFASGIPTDAWITTKVKLTLLTSEGSSAIGVNVDTVGRKVTLHGIVNSQAARDSVERSAAGVEGVQSVRNLIQVVLPSQEARVEARDEKISEDVSAALAAEPSLKGSSISVQSVNKGVVLLKGNAKSLSDHLTAVQLAAGVTGVQRVASEIQNESELADSSIWKNPDAAQNDASVGTLRGAANDLYITSMVKMRLLADSQTPALDINVDTHNGAVTLFGIVPTEESKAAAEGQARKAGGVVSVKNQLEVVASAAQPVVKANDDVVEHNVKQSLEKYTSLGSVDIEVSNCVVRLTGTVPSGVERVEALQIARATTGVCAVKDDLMIR